MAGLGDTEFVFPVELPNFNLDIFHGREETKERGRFRTFTESDVENLIAGEENANTKKKRFLFFFPGGFLDPLRLENSQGLLNGRTQRDQRNRGDTVK